MITSDAFRNKQYAVLGLARSGLSAVETLAASGARIIAWDAREEARDAVADKAQVTDPMTTPLYGLDGIVVSPGLPLHRPPLADRAEDATASVLGEIALFSQARARLPPPNRKTA